ncbi:MAG: 6-hydroxymethylpterin diphosphokinase MptE-like protein [Pseudomonadota bacterium]
MALQTNDLTELFSSPRVELWLGHDPDLISVFKKAQRALQLEDIQILRHGPSFLYDPGYHELLDAVFIYVNNFSAQGGTALVMGRKFVLNRFRNMRGMRNNYLIDSVKDMYKDLPAVLVAGGPSLDKNIHHLGRIKGKALIFAVDTVVPILLNLGIIPDFVASIDPLPLTYEKFNGAELPETGLNLICSGWLASKVVSTFPAEKLFWTFGGRIMENWINKTLGGKIPSIGAGTVAHMNLHAAIIMGCSPIVFVGQDLAYSEEKDHAQNVALGDNLHMKKVLTTKDNWIWVKGIYGGRVRTSRTFSNYKSVFEGIIRQNDAVHFINATEGGAFIEGTDVERLETLAETWEKNNFSMDGSLLDNIRPMGDGAIEALGRELDALVGKGKKLMGMIREADLLIRDLRKELSGLKKKPRKYSNLSGFPGKIQQKIQRIEKLSAQLDDPGLFWHLFDEITIEGLKKSERMLHDIKGDPLLEEGSIDWIVKNLDRLDYINSVRKDIWEWLEPEVKAVIQFHAREKELIQASDKLPLSRFYFDHGFIALAMRVLNSLDPGEADDNPEIHFIRGVSTALTADISRAEPFFRQAVESAPEMGKRIHKFRMDCADEYLGYGITWASKDLNSSRRFFIKGLCFVQNHKELADRLIDCFDRDMKVLEGDVRDNLSPKGDVFLKPWTREIEQHPFIIDVLGKERLGSLYVQCGKAAALEKDYGAAVSQYEKAIEFSPDKSEYYIHLMDVCFVCGDLDKGVNALTSAIALDHSNARYWEMIGDNFFQGGSFQDALTAWEQCFLTMPERIELLTKMGTAYLKLGQGEAAEEAYRQYACQLEKRGEAKPKP